MSFGAGMARGASMAASIPRPKLEPMRITGAAPQRSKGIRQDQRAAAGNNTPDETMGATRQERFAVEENAAQQAEARKLNLDQKRDTMRAENKAERKDAEKKQIGKDYDLALAGVAVGNTKMAEDFINKHGNPEVGASITVGEGGRVTMAPNNGGKPIEFPDARSFYSNFFGALRPEGAGFSLPQPAEGDWTAIADGTRIMNKPTGEIRETGYTKPQSGSGSGKSSGSPSAGPLMEQADNYILNRVMNRIQGSDGEMSLAAQDILRSVDGGGDNSAKKLDFDRVKQFMTPEEVKAYNLATTTAQQMKAEGAPDHVIANKVAVSMRGMIEGIDPTGGSATPRKLAAPPQEEPQNHPAARMPADERGIQRLSVFLGSLPQHGGAREQALNEIAEINPDLVVAYYESLKKAGGAVNVPNPASRVRPQ